MARDVGRQDEEREHLRRSDDVQYDSFALPGAIPPATKPVQLGYRARC